MSWHRFLPKTLKAFEESGGIWMNKYNIVRRGTMGTLIPFLTGKHVHDLNQAARTTKNTTHLNDSPWLWNTLKAHGYSTLFTDAGSLNWKYIGFKAPPTDNYGRAYHQALAPLRKKNRKFYLKSRPRLSITHEYVAEFWNSYPDNPKFALIN